MSFEENRMEVIERLVEYVAQKLPQDEAPLVKNFVRQYYLRVSPEDLTSRSILDLYGAVVSHWHYIQQRLPGEAKVRVLNPQLEKDGWQSAHTIIEIVFDDMPFLVDSISMALRRLNLNIHLIIHMGNMTFSRDAEGKIVKILAKHSKINSVKPEAAIYIEIDRQSDPIVLSKITSTLTQVLLDVNTVVIDWSSMKTVATQTLEEIKKIPAFANGEEWEEGAHFLEWTIADHFTFLGFQEFKIEERKGVTYYTPISGSELGMLKINHELSKPYCLTDFPAAAQALILSHDLLILGKTSMRSTVHRPSYADFIAVKIFDAHGKILKLRFFVGLYTAVTYNSSPKQIPLLRRKVLQVLNEAGFSPKSHDDRALLNILETLPRDDLFQANWQELLELSTGILHLQERQKIRLFVRHEIFGNFVSCLVFVPRERYTSILSEKIRDILLKGYNGLEVEFDTRFSESSLARIHYVIRLDPNTTSKAEVRLLEKKLIETARTWQDDFRDALIEDCGEEEGNFLYKRYRLGFPAGYRENFRAKMAVIDIRYFENLSENSPLAMSLYTPLEEKEEVIRFKLFKLGTTIPLSDVVPILENMGLRIISERPYEITQKKNKNSFWINDYKMVQQQGLAVNIESVKEIFQEAFDHIWSGNAENDKFNKLILTANLSWREIMVLRAYAKYLWQAGFNFSQDHVEETLNSNPEIAFMLVELFKMRFNKDALATDVEQLLQKQKIEKALEGVSNLNEDRILRRYTDILFATIRTNYYQKDVDGNPKSYFSFKLHSAKVPELPLPVPLYEIFVYSPRVEAIHLRGGKVARGGIRWSDRREDFRTEILGLMKTQQVKNAVIVPLGAKGGFVVKRMPIGTREQIMEEVVYCYQTLIRGLLDLTDNYKGNEILSPKNTVHYDDADPYLVVAADKGTATFSDIANELSKEYGFWLQDAFASGGATGYDHKKMGITARGAWESVKRHFQEMGFDEETQDFTVIGIGDMAGDVFGNGMLLSKHIKLIAAFNHMHIFLDPNPNPETSFQERYRLFHLPRSTWGDYNPELISNGGGVFLRSAKSITLSPEIQEALDFYHDKIVPNDLIKAILKAPVALIWNGGIGTYVKSKSESNISVGDRTNDVLRINGDELRCKVVGEGGNLGFTQLGRVEFALLGGHINTDAIDNSGGVNCSDNEVNIKILLNEVVAEGDLTEKQRNELLVEIQEEVAALVLKNNILQTKAISVAASLAVENLEMHGRLIQEMERSGRLDRVLECLPNKEELSNRKINKLGLTRPEIAVLMAYSKTMLKEALLNSNLPEDPYFQRELENAFPKPLQLRFKSFMVKHRLKREIIATQLSNIVVNEMGITFINRLQDETGSSSPDIMRAYTVSRQIFSVQELYDAIDALKTTVDATIQHNMLQEVNRLVRRGTRWFLRNRWEEINIAETIKHFSSKVSEVSAVLPSLLPGYSHEIESMAEGLMAANVPEFLAKRVACMSAMFSALDIIEAASIYQYPIENVANIYFTLGNRLQLGWFRELIKKQRVNTHWEALARATFRDDLDRQQRSLTVNIMNHNGKHYHEPLVLVDKWMVKHQRLTKRWDYFVNELKNPGEVGFTLFAVALRELLDIVQASTHSLQSD